MDRQTHIEYCLGIELKNETLYAIVSQNDAYPILVESSLIDLHRRVFQTGYCHQRLISNHGIISSPSAQKVPV